MSLEKPKTCLGEVNAKYEVAALKAVYLQLVADLQDPLVNSDDLPTLFRDPFSDHPLRGWTAV